VIQVALSGVRDFAALGTRWRALEDRSDPSFFQSWTWTGCLAEERFPDPILAEATEDGATMGLALFDRRRGFGRDVLFLGETGADPWDRLAIEHNGPLVARGRQDAAKAILHAAVGRADLILSGMTATGPGILAKTQPAPFAIPDAAYMDRRSANTREQIRRSDRAFGTPPIARAETEAEAHAWLDEMAVLHQASWTARGKPGSFADPAFGRFHHQLIQRGMARGEIDLWRVGAGRDPVGILYNFRLRARVSAYQSGFAYNPADARRKPGLTCHRLAIEACGRDGIAVYDFLAGDDRYKRSLADGAGAMHWLLAGPWWSPRLLAHRGRRLAGRLRDALVGRR
jgi:CelD/BcsL family acetyltransferase involved in cellulose biosynthesis